MPNVAHLSLRALGRNIFEAVGVPPDQSAIVTDHLVDSNLFGHDSHGMMHAPGYVRGLRSGGIVPVGDMKFVRDAPASAVIDAQQGFGIVVARRAMEMAVDRVKEHTLGAIAVHQASHIGRLGEYACLAAEKDCVERWLTFHGAVWRDFAPATTESDRDCRATTWRTSPDARHHYEYGSNG